MKSFLIHISDSRGIDEQAAIRVEDGLDIGRAAQLALDEVVEKHGKSLSFPIFIDIHLAANFQDRAWMHDCPSAISV